MPTLDRGDGVSIHYEVTGSGPPVLLAMGLAAPSIGWYRQVPAFAERYRTIVFDNRGAGRSSRPRGPYTIRLLADDALAVLDALDVERAHLVGVSMGGMIAQEVAIERPERVGALVLASTYAAPRVEAEPPRHFVAMQQAFAAGDPLAFTDAILEATFSPEFLAEPGNREKLLGAFMAASPDGISSAGIFGQLAAAMGHDARARLDRIRAPTLVLTGTADGLIAPVCSEELTEGIAGATLCRITGGSHGVNAEKPDPWNRHVLGFLAKHDRLLAAGAR